MSKGQQEYETGIQLFTTLQTQLQSATKLNDRALLLTLVATALDNLKTHQQNPQQAAMVLVTRFYRSVLADHQTVEEPISTTIKSINNFAHSYSIFSRMGASLNL